jgi:hypothetical protein
MLKSKEKSFNYEDFNQIFAQEKGQFLLYSWWSFIQMEKHFKS